MSMKRWNVFLPEELLSELRKIAQSRGVAVSDLVREALERLVNEANHGKSA